MYWLYAMVFYWKPSVHMDLVVLKKAANSMQEFHKISREITPKYFASYFVWLHWFICQRHQTENVEMIGSWMFVRKSTVHRRACCMVFTAAVVRCERFWLVTVFTGNTIISAAVLLTTIYLISRVYPKGWNLTLGAVSEKKAWIICWYDK